MAPSRKDKGKTQIDEGSSEHQEYAQHAPSLKSRRLTFDFRNQSLIPVKYGNLSSFPFNSFDFPELLRCQGVYSMVSVVEFITRIWLKISMQFGYCSWC